MSYSQPHPDAPPISIVWRIENDTVLPWNPPFRHADLPDRAQFRLVTPPSDLAVNPDLDEWHWCINTWQIVYMPDPRTGEWYKFVKVAECHRMTQDEITRFKAHVGFEAAVQQAIEARQRRIDGYKAKEALEKGA
jgi:hypothetical protein